MTTTTSQSLTSTNKNGAVSTTALYKSSLIGLLVLYFILHLPFCRYIFLFIIELQSQRYEKGKKVVVERQVHENRNIIHFDSRFFLIFCYLLSYHGTRKTTHVDGYKKWYRPLLITDIWTHI